MKYIIVYAEGFNNKIMVVDEPNKPDNQNRIQLFNDFYDNSNLIKNFSLPSLDCKDLDKLEKKVYSFLNINYRNNLLSKVKISPFHHKATKMFLGNEYQLYIIEDRLAILGIDLYNINIYAKQHNMPIQYKAFGTKKEMSLSDIWHIS